MKETAVLKNQVILKHFADSNTEAFVKLVERILLPELNCDVILSNQRGSTHNLRSGKDFSIFIWSTPLPLSSRTTKAPRYIFNIPVSIRSDVFQSSFGDLIVDSKSGYEIAELIGNNLYIFHKASYYEDENEKKIFRKILLETVKLLHKRSELPTSGGVLKESATSQKGFQETILKAINIIPSGRLEERIQGSAAKYKDKIKEKIAELYRLQKELANLYRLRNNELGELEARKDPDFIKKKAAFLTSEIKAIEVLPNVEKVILKTDYIGIYTKTMFCDLYQLGRFFITLPLDTDKPVLMYNLTNRQSDYMAPHVDDDGMPCLGNMCEVFPELIGNREWSTLASLAIQFLETCNNSNYIDASRWPEVSKIEKAKLQKLERQKIKIVKKITKK
jgi:hypothetical protein